MLVVLAFGMVLNRRLPDGEHFPGQPFGFWTSPPKDRVRWFEPRLRLQTVWVPESRPWGLNCEFA